MSHSNALWVYLDQFGQRVHKPSCYRDSPSDSYILVGELVPCSLRCGVYRCAILADNVYVRLVCACYVGHGTFQYIRGLPACRSVAHSYCLNVVFPCQTCECGCCFQAITFGWKGIYHIVMQQVSLSIEHYHLASCPYARVNSHHAFLSERCVEEQLLKVACEHFYGLSLSLLTARSSKLVLHAWCEQTLVRVVNCLANKLGASSAATNITSVYTLQGIVAINGYAYVQYTICLASPHG